MENSFFAGRFGVNGVERQGDFNEFFAEGHIIPQLISGIQ